MALDLTFDPSYGGDSSGVDLTFDPAFKPKKQNKGIASDLVTDFKRGIEQLPGIVTGLADIPIAAITGDTYADKAANVLGDITGFQPSKWAKDAEAEYSPKRRASSMAVDKAWQDNASPFSDAMDGDFSGIGNIAKAYAQNPLHTLGAVVESLPAMAAGGVVSKGLTAAKLATSGIAAGIGEGSVMAGGAMNQLTEDGVDARTASMYAAPIGIVGGAIGVGGGKLAKAMGVVDPDVAMAGGVTRAVADEAKDQTIKGAIKEGAKRVAGGAMSEGFFEELPQSVLEQTLSNLAQGKPWDEGVSRAAVEGTLAGSLMGGAFNVLPPSVQAPGQQPPADPNQNPLLALPAPTYTGTPGNQIVAADVERQAAIDKAQADADALYASRDAYEREQRRGFPGGVPTITNDPAPIQQRIDALLGINQDRLTGIARTNYEKALDAAFNERIGFAVGKDSMEIPVTMGDYLASKVAAGDIDRNSELGRRVALLAGMNAEARLQQLADEETMQQPDIAPIPVVGPLSAAANVAVQTGVSAQVQLQQAAEAMAQQQEGKPAEQAPASTNPLTAAMQQGGISAAVPEQVAQEAPQTNDAQAASFDVTKRTDKQLEYLTQHGQPGWKEAAAAELQKRGVQVSVPQQAKIETSSAEKPANSDKPVEVEVDADESAPTYGGKYDKVFKGKVPSGWYLVGKNTSGNNVYQAGGSRIVEDGEYFVQELAHKPKEERYAEFRTKQEIEKMAGRNTAPAKEAPNIPNGDGITSQPPKQQAPAPTEEPKAKKPLSVGVMPGAAEPITVKDGVVHIGKYPAQNFDTGEDVTVPAGATDRQVVTALKDAGAIAGKMRVFGMEKEEVKDAIGWTSMTTVEREGLLHRAGYGGANMRLNLAGTRISRTAWDAMSPAVRDKLTAAHENQFKPVDQAQAKSEIDAAANEAATSAKNDTPQPTEAQQEAGNYKKGHITVQGLNITIENPEGSKRSGTDEDGKAWEATMAAHYGYIKRTEGNDGDHVDVYVGNDPDSDIAFIVDQSNADGSFDEHKVLLGFANALSATRAYAKSYEPGWMASRVIAAEKLTVSELKEWLKNGDMSKPYSSNKADQPSAETVTAPEQSESGNQSEQVLDMVPAVDAVSQPKTDAAPEAKQEQAPAITPQHVENGEAETATAAVVEQSLKKGAANSPLDLRQERDLLLKKVDAAIAAAPTAEEKDAWNRVEQRIDLTNNMHVADTIGYRIFDVPGDGKFKVLNLKEALQRFRDRVESNPGFKKSVNTTGLQKVAPWQRTTSGGTEAMTKELLEDGEYSAAVEYAKQIGKPLVFGQYQDGSVITVYTEAKPFEREGYDDFKMVSARNPQGSDKVAWAVIDLNSGLTISSQHPTRLKAIAETNKALEKMTPEQLATGIKSAKANNSWLVGTQDELEARWLENVDKREAEAQARAEQAHRRGLRSHRGMISDATGKPVEEAGKPAAQNTVATTQETDDQRYQRVKNTPPGQRSQADVDFANAHKAKLNERAQAAEKAAQQAKDETLNDTDGFAESAGKNAALQQKIRNALNMTVSVNGEHMRRKETIRKSVNGGATIGVREGQRALINSDGTHRLESQLTKTGIDYAEYLIAKRDEKPAALKIGDAAQLMNIDVILAKTVSASDGVLYELFNANSLKDGRAVIRRTDIDSGGVIGIRSYNDYDQAEAEFNKAGSIASSTVDSKNEPKSEKLVGSRRNPEKVNIFNPYEDGDIVSIGGKEWQIRNDGGWYLTSNGNWRGEHPTIKKISAMTDLIAMVEKDVLAANDSEKSGKPSPLELTPKQYHDARLKWIAERNGVPLSEVRESYDTDAGRKESEIEWVDAVRQAFKNGTELNRATLDKLEEIRPGAVAAFSHDYPEAKVPNGYQTPEARSVEKQNKADRQEDRKAIAAERKPADDGKPDNKAEDSKPSATADAGEELTYNKRNRRAGGVKWDDIKDKNAALRVKEVNKAKVYPKPDYRAMVDGGMKDVVAHIVKQAYDAIAPKPKLKRGAEASDEALQSYIAGVNRVMDGVMKWANDAAAVAKWAATQSKLAGRTINISELAAASTLLDTVYPNGWKANRDELIMLGGNKLLGALQPGYDEVGRAMRDIKLGWPASVESWQKQGMKVVHVDTLTVDLYSSPARPNRAAYVSGMLSVGKQRIDTFVLNGTDNKEDTVVQEIVADRKRELEGKYVLLDKSSRPLGVFESEEVATESAREKAKKETSEKISEKGVSVEIAERVGVEHRLPGDDVTSERLMETFGFRGVNFGNWMQGDTKAKVAERQLHLNHLYDAFMDLAQLLNLPPKAMSLNGMLGIAVGAQGSGKALAHFVPGVNEINVTRTKGAGALAHEWGHALDHYFATMGGLDRKADPYLSAHVGTMDGRVVDGKYVRAPVDLANVRPEVAAQFQSIVEAMTKRKETKDEYEDRLKSEKTYAVRLVAEEIKKITDAIEKAKDSWGTPELIAKMRGFSERISNLDYGDGRVSVYGGDVPSVVAELDAEYQTASGTPLPNVAALGYYSDRYKVISGLLESSEKWEPATVRTDYDKASSAADAKRKQYWSTKLEMFARAFDAYVVDSLAEKDGKNSYLAGIEAVAPQGDERKAIGKAFDFLFAELKTKETERGTAVYNIAGNDALSPADKAIYGMAAEGKSAADILKFIASASRNPFNRQVAKLLLKTGIAPKVMAGTSDGWRFNAGNDKKYAAAYNEKTDTIALFRPAAAERNFVHEAIHAATIRALGRKGLAAGQMKALFAHVQKTGKLKGMYGMSDVDEFVAEAFSNPKFQDALKQVAAPKASGALSSAWNWFVRIVRGILGLPANQDNALSQALEIGLGVMRENMRLTGDPQNGNVRGMPDNSTASGRGNNAPAPEADIGEAIKAGLAIDTSTYEVLHDDDPRYPFFAKNKGDSSGRAKKRFKTADDAQQWIDEKQKSIDQENREVIDLFKRGVSITEQNRKFDAKTKSNTFAINETSKSEAIRIAKVRLEQEAKQANDPHEIPMYIRDEELPAVRNGYTRFWHGSGEHATITEINEGGLFGGLFAAYSESSAHGPGDPWRYYYIDVKDDDIASHRDLVRAFYKNEKPGIDAIRKYTVAWISKKDLLDIAEKVLEDTDSWIFNTGDNYGRSDEALRVSELLYVPMKHEWPGLPFNGKDGDDGQLSWFMQRVRGAVAKAYGFKAVKMNDEHGISVLVLPGNKVNKVDLENPEFDFSKFKQSDFKTWRQFKNEPTASAGSDAIRYNVAEDGWSVAEPSKMDDVIYALQDKQIDMKRVVQSIKATGKKIRDNFNPYLQEELFHGRAAKGVKDFLDFELRPLLKEMQDKGVDMGDFEEYLWNRHAEERNKQIAKINTDIPDGGSGIATAEARAYLTGLSAEQKAKYEALAKRVDAMNRGSQKVLVESGLESAETIAAWNGAYQSYVPLQREDVDSGHVGTGKGFSIRGSSSKRAMGSGRQVVDIIANLTMQRERNIVRAEKNRVSNALMGLAMENPNPEFWKVDQAPKERVVNNVAIYNVLDAEGNKVADFTSMAEADRMARSLGGEVEQTWGDRVQERIEPGFKNRDNVVLTRVNGKDHYIIFNERDERAMRMAQSLKNLDVDNMGRVLSVVGKATRYLASVNTQYNPVFGVINLIRDAQGALVNLTSTPLAGDQKKVLGYTVDALRGIYADIRAHRRGEKPSSNWANLFEEFQKEGGQTGYRDQYANAEARAEAIQSELEQFKEGKAKQLTRGLFGWLSDYNETMENAVRLAAYKASKEKGMSKQQAASLAKNITVNFNRKGQMATQVGALYAFFNASVQGTARIAETLFDMKDGDIKTARLSKTGKKIVLGGIMLGSMQALLLAAAGYDDDEPPEFVRERNLVLPVGDGKYLTLAMPLGFHVLPGIGRIATEFVLSGGKDPIKKLASFAGMFADTFNPVGNAGFSLQSITPSVVDPFAALAENRDFTGKEIYRENFNANDPTPGHARAKDVATVWSRVISESLNWLTGGTEFKPGLMSWSPDAIDYLIGQAGGGVMREANKLAQTVGSGVTGEDLPLYKIPLVGRFVGDTQGQSGQSAKFYDAIKQINMHEAEYKGLIKDGRRQEAMEYMAENPAVKLMMAGNHAESTVRKLRSIKRDLVEKDAGQDQIRAIDDRITATMRAFNERAGAAI